MILREYEISIWNDYQIHEYEVYNQYDSDNDIYSEYLDTIQVKVDSFLMKLNIISLLINGLKKKKL